MRPCYFRTNARLSSTSCTRLILVLKDEIKIPLARTEFLSFCPRPHMLCSYFGTTDSLFNDHAYIFCVFVLIENRANYANVLNCKVYNKELKIFLVFFYNQSNRFYTNL